MTSIRMLALSHTIGYVILMSILTIATRWIWIFPQQQQLAMEHQERELTSIQNAIKSFHESLIYLADDYSNYPEIIAAIENPNLIDINTAKQEFDLVRHELEYFAFSDKDNNVILSLYKSGDNSEIYEFEKAQNTIHANRLKESKTHQVIEYYELFNKQAVMGVTYPIYNEEADEAIGRISISWKLYGDSLKGISDIVQIKIQPSSNSEIHLSKKTDLFKKGLDEIAEKHVRCLYNQNNILVNCFTIYHDKQLIPEFLTLGILARILAFSMVPLLFFTLMLNYLIRPLEQTTRFLRSTSLKKNIVRLAQQAPIIELEEMRIAFNELVDVTQQHKDQLALQSMTDALTDIPNRRAFDREIHKTRSRLQRHSGTAALIICDIDYFKLFNDHYGHLHGDEILTKVAGTLHQFGRRTDEICARYGGEEFAIILSNINTSELENILTSINTSINSLQEPHDQSPHKKLTISCGATYIESKGTSSNLGSVEDWIKEADQALYLAKESGRNCHKISTFDLSLKSN